MEDHDIKKNEYQKEHVEKIKEDPIEEQALHSAPLFYFDSHNRSWFFSEEHLRRLDPRK